MKKTHANYQPNVAIIVLNWNGWRDTIECLESLFQATYDNFQVVLVDNGSTDGSIEKIKQWAEGKLTAESKYLRFNPANKPMTHAELLSSADPLSNKDARLILIRMKENVGFARGNNVGIRFALSSLDCEYIMILNNDMVVRPDFLPPLLEVFDKYPQAGLSGPKILDYRTGAHRQGALSERINIFTIIMFFTPLKIFFERSPVAGRFLLPDSGYKKVYGIAGCCMLFKRGILEQIGLFDEATYLGWEEYIMAEKLLARGKETIAASESVVYHKLGQSTAKMLPAERTIVFLKSEKYFQENYLKMPDYQRSLIKMIRLLTYSIIAPFSPSFRKQYKQLLDAILD